MDNDTQMAHASEDLVVVPSSSTEVETAAARNGAATNVVGGVVDVERPDPPVEPLRESDVSTTPVIVDMESNNHTHHSSEGGTGTMIRPLPPTLRSGEEVNAKNTLQSHSIVGSTIPASTSELSTASWRSTTPRGDDAPGSLYWVAEDVDEAINKNEWITPPTEPVTNRTQNEDPDLFASAMVLNDDDTNNVNRTLGTAPPLAPILLPAPIIDGNMVQQNDIDNEPNSDGDDVESPDNVAAIADDKAQTDNRALVSSKRWIVGLLIVLILAIVSVAVVAGVCGTGGCATTRSSPQIVVVTTAAPIPLAAATAPPSAATLPVESSTYKPTSGDPNEPVIPSTTVSSPTPTMPNPSMPPVIASTPIPTELTVIASTPIPTELTPNPTVMVPPPTTTTTSPPMVATSSGSPPTGNPSNVLFQPPVNTAPIPEIEDGFLYSASYVGRFQYVRDTSCFGPTNPDISIYCEGQVKLTGRSDERITCNEILPDNEAYLDRTTGIQCFTNCTDAECAEIFLTQDRAYGSLPFGQIYFQCSGNTLADVTPLFLYAGNDLDEYGCSAVSNDNSTRNFHLAQLGVSCPTLDGTGQEYVFDDFYFDCSGGTATEFVADFPTDSIACLEGRNCRGQDCEVDMGNNIVIGEPKNYLDRCAASVVEITPAPTPMVPNITEDTVLVTSVIFQARWAVLMDSDESNSTMFDCFGGGNQIIRITCPSSDIELVNKTFPDTTICSTDTPGILQCLDSGNAYLNEFSSVTYRCTGATLPATSVTYPSTNAYCEGNDVAVRVRHAVEIGVYCGSIGEFYFGSFYYECEGVSPEFSIGNDPALNYTQYTCSQFVEFPIGSKQDTNYTIPLLSIGTGRDWLIDNDDTCFTFESNGDLVGTTSPTSAPLAPLFQGLSEGVKLTKVGDIGGDA